MAGRENRLGPIDYFGITLIGLYCLYAPFTKVEESFNIQAIHDIIFHGTDLSKYDHVEFPGVVPRTFVGAGILGIILKPLEVFMPGSFTKLDYQLFARGILGVINGFSMITLRHTILNYWDFDTNGQKCRNNSKLVSIWYVAFQFAQFHVVFYASRPLPNMFCLCLVNYAFSYALRGEYLSTIRLLSFATAVFRSELVLLVASFCFILLVTRRVNFGQLNSAIIRGVGPGIVICAVVDGYFWKNTPYYAFPMVPEVYGFVFNVVQGNSTLWGVEPWYAYFTHHIPNMVTNPVVIGLLPAGLLFDLPSPARVISLSCSLFVAIYSAQPHKEWRFVVYVMPMVAVVAANGASYCWQRRTLAAPVYKVLNAVIVLSTIGSYVLSYAKLQTSALNYPGGEALSHFNSILDPSTEPHLPVTVHLDVPVCMTGATRFGESYNDAIVKYDKTENEEVLNHIWPGFDYLITYNDDSSSLPSEPGYVWKAVGSVKGFQGLNKELLSYILEEVFANPQEYLLESIESVRRSKSLTDDFKQLWYKAIRLNDVVFIYRKVKNSVDDIEI